MYHANQISEHSKIEETVKDDFHDPNNNRHQDGEVKLVFFNVLFCYFALFSLKFEN